MIKMMKYTGFTLFLSALFVLNVHRSLSQFVTIPKGGVQGMRLTHLNKHVDVFFGIPYAKPPVGELRFQYPQPTEAWAPLAIDVMTPKPSCLQPVRLSPPPEEYRRISGDFSEDCLYLNIWTPVEMQNVPVMVWFHGGRFLEGSAQLQMFNGQFMAGESDVIVVSVSYRLGPLGFAYLGPDSIPGNFGLMDQTLALTWIKENIVHFGGDPNKVTLFGQDSGAVSVGFHLLSPLSQSLFDKAILQSGTPIAYWSYNDRFSARNHVMRLGKAVGCSWITDQDLLACLRASNAHQLVINDVPMMTDDYPFLPVVDGIFLPDEPIKLLESGRFKNTSILHGVVEDEATLKLYKMLGGSPSDVSLSYDQYVELLQTYLRNVNDKLRHDSLTLYYESEQEIGTDINYLDILSQIQSDVDYKCPALEFGKYFSKQNPTYLYSFHHKISKSPYPSWVGATHGYELEMVFGLPINVTLGFVNDEQQLSWFVMTYWTNFAKTGDPNSPMPVKVNWLPYDVTNKYHMALDVSNKLKNQQGLRHRECVFIKQILPLISSNATLEDNGKKQNITSLEDIPLKCPDLLDLPFPILAALSGGDTADTDDSGSRVIQTPSMFILVLLASLICWTRTKLHDTLGRF